MRPLSEDEANGGETNVTSFPEEDSVVVLVKGEKKLFEFERVYTPDISQGS